MPLGRVVISLIERLAPDPVESRATRTLLRKASPESRAVSLRNSNQCPLAHTGPLSCGAEAVPKCCNLSGLRTT